MCTFVKDTARKMLERLRLVQTKTDTLGLALTFASLHALRPPVLNIYVPGSSAVLKPSTTRSATTDYAGFLKRAALWARRRFENR